jgi:hypothetical protein
MNKKYCLYCHLLKPLDAFGKDKKYKTGISSKCRICAAIDRKVSRMYCSARKASAAGETLLLVSNK